MTRIVVGQAVPDEMWTNAVSARFRQAEPDLPGNSAYPSF